MQFKSQIESTSGEIDVIVFFDYQPSEKDTNTQENITITSVFFGKEDIFSILTKEQLQNLECEAWNELAWIQDNEEGHEFDNWHNKHKGEV